MRDTKYRRVAAGLRRSFAGQPDGSRLPSEKDLAREYAVSLMTIRRAFEVLDDEGFVNRIVGRGTFVQRRIVAKGDSLTSFSEDMRMRGLEPSTRVIGIEVLAAPDAVSRDLRLHTAEKVVTIERLRLADGEPMCLEVAHLPARFAPVLDHGDLNGSLHALLAASGTVILTGTRRIRAVLAGDRACGLLGLAGTAPALQVVQVFFDAQGRPVQRSSSLYRADRYEAFSRVRRPDLPPTDATD
ncbi:GntR family transcriptional regulator [Cryobacterium frigoriphilum]|uniref:GntR family transcriptional regulator n=1 Tax=Cryobacterium frigoriphilum TaxID=1259150 RepID=A0A4R9A8V3_9MICO|nr:GntR family transcriptional regulator [Cryobacterium frigoriphilum]TFD53556.1 GntR family transcriptional regulator [Cryobacterium frigoriphilum]